MQKLRAFSKSKDSESDYEKPKRSFTAPGSPKSLNKDIPTSPSSSLNAVTAESSGKLSPELAPIVSLLSAQSHRKYQEGVFMLLKDLDSDGSPSDRKWMEVYGIMIGNELAYWDSDQLESSGSIVLGDNKPSYINFSDGTFKPCLKLPSANGSIENVIVLSTTLKNRFLLQFPTKEEFHGWSCAFRLASFEFKSLQEAYTASLLSSRGALLSDIRVILSEKKFNYEDWVSVRFGAGMPWKRCFAVIEPSKKSRKGFKHGFIYFYENEKMSKKLLMAKITSISSVYALYPRNYTIIDKSTLIKLDGAIQFDQKESSKSCSIFLMPEQHTSVPGYDTLIRFLIPLMDSFNLYGRPTRLNADKTDIDSLLFGLPVLPKVHYLEVDDLLPMADNLGSIDWDQNEWNANIKKFLKSKLDRGYTGCGSEDGVNGAIDMLNSSKDMADGKIRFFINKPEANRYLENSPHARSIHQMSSSEENTINPSASASASRLELADSHSSNSTGNVKPRSAHHHHHHHNPHPLQGQPQQAQHHTQYQQPSKQNINPTIQLSNDSLNSPERSEHNSTPQNASAFANNSPSPQVVNIYTKYSEIPDSEKLNYGKHTAADLSHTLQKVKLEDDEDDEDIFKERRAPKKKTATVDDLYPSGDINDEGDDEEYEEQYSGRQYRPDSDGDDDDDEDEDDEDEDDPGFAFISPKTEGDRVFSPFTNFNNDFRKAIQMDENQRVNNNGSSSIDKVKNKGENLNLHLNLPKQRSPMKNVINSHDNNVQPLGTDRKVEGVNRYFSNPTDSKPFSQERRAPSGNIVPQQPPFDAHGVHPPVNPYSSTQPHTPVAQVLGSPATPAAPKQARDLSPFGKPSKLSNYESNGPDSPLGPDYSRQPPAPPQHQNIKYTNSPELIPPHQYKSNGPIAPNLKSNMNGSVNPNVNANSQQSSRNAANPLNSPGNPSFGAYGPMKLPSPVVNGNTNAQHFPRNQQSNSNRRPAPPQGQGNGPPFPQQMGYPLGSGPGAGPGSNPNPNGYDYSTRPDYNQYPPNQNQPHHQPPQPYQQQYQQQYHPHYQQPPPPPPPPQQQRPPPNQYGVPHYGNQPMAPPQGYGPPPGGNPMMYPPNGTQSGMKMGRRPPPNQQQQQQQQQPASGRSFKHDPYALTKK